LALAIAGDGNHDALNRGVAGERQGIVDGDGGGIFGVADWAGTAGDIWRRIVVVVVSGGNVGRIDAAVVRVGAGGRVDDDGVADVAIDAGFLDPGDDDGLIEVPVAGGERQHVGGEGAFGEIGAV